MTEAIEENEGLKMDEEAKEKITKYFTYTAHYLVSAMVYMRSDQVRKCSCVDVRFVEAAPVLYRTDASSISVKWRDKD